MAINVIKVTSLVPNRIKLSSESQARPSEITGLLNPHCTQVPKALKAYNNTAYKTGQLLKSPL